MLYASLLQMTTTAIDAKMNIEINLIYRIRRCLIGVGSITEVKQRRARFIIGWVTAWDCQVPYTLGHRAVMSCRGAQRTT